MRKAGGKDFKKERERERGIEGAWERSDEGLREKEKCLRELYVALG